MAWHRDSLQTIATRIRGDIDSGLTLADRLRRNMLDVLGKAWAGAVHGLYGYGAYIAKQIFPWSADKENLARHAGWWGVNPKLAVAAKGPVTFEGVEGAVFPADASMSVDSLLFTSTTSGTVQNGTVTVSVIAQQVGIASNLPAGIKLSLTSPVAGILPDGVVGAEGITGGSEAEQDDSLLSRLEFRVQNTPAGGAPIDYVRWARSQEKHGVEVTRAWVYPREMGRGTVTVRFMTDGIGNGIPSAQAVADVKAYIETVRPATADVFVVAPIAVPLQFTILGLNPVTSTVQTAVENELKDLIRRESTPGGTLLISHIREAISIAAGEHDHELVQPDGNVAHDTGKICVFGGITWG